MAGLEDQGSTLVNLSSVSIKGMGTQYNLSKKDIMTCRVIISGCSIFKLCGKKKTLERIPLLLFPLADTLVRRHHYQPSQNLRPGWFILEILDYNMERFSL